MKKEAKTKEQIEAEKQESQRLVSEIIQMTGKVPQSVISGSYQTAVAWKNAAKKAVIAARTTPPRINSLRAAHSALTEFREQVD